MSERLTQATELSQFKLRAKPDARAIGPTIDKATPVGELKVIFSRALCRIEYIAFRNEMQKAFKGHVLLDISFDDDCAKLLIDSMPIGLVLYSLSKVEGLTCTKLKKLRRPGEAALLVCTYQVLEKV
jgi:hypothetical protein